MEVDSTSDWPQGGLDNTRHAHGITGATSQSINLEESRNCFGGLLATRKQTVDTDTLNTRHHPIVETLTTA